MFICVMFSSFSIISIINLTKFIFVKSMKNLLEHRYMYNVHVYCGVHLLIMGSTGTFIVYTVQYIYIYREIQEYVYCAAVHTFFEN